MKPEIQRPQCLCLSKLPGHLPHLPDIFLNTEIIILVIGGYHFRHKKTFFRPLGISYPNIVIYINSKFKTLEKHRIEEIIFNYLNGTASANDVERLRVWLSSEENKKIFEAVSAHWRSSRVEVKSPDVDKAYDKLMEKINKGKGDKVYSIHQPQKPFASSGTQILRYAAIFILLFSISGLLLYHLTFTETTQNHVETILFTKQSPKGQKLTTWLPDGSKVILNSGSSIKYIFPFTGSARVVQLEGEAFFEVEKDPAKPFIVKANGISTTALGTSFNVKCLSDHSLEVSLLTGKVKVKKEGSKQFVVLRPGKSATVNNNGDMEVKDFNYLQNIGWKDGILYFNNNSFQDVIQKLENWYDVKFIGAQKIISSSRYKGTFKNEMLEDVLRGLSFVYGFEYKIQKDTVIIDVKPKQ